MGTGLLLGALYSPPPPPHCVSDYSTRAGTPRVKRNKHFKYSPTSSIVKHKHALQNTPTPMCVCLCVCVCVCVCVCMRPCVRTHPPTPSWNTSMRYETLQLLRVCVRACARVCVYTCTCVRPRACVCLSLWEKIVVVVLVVSSRMLCCSYPSRPCCGKGFYLLSSVSASQKCSPQVTFFFCLR